MKIDELRKLFADPTAAQIEQEISANRRLYAAQDRPALAFKMPNLSEFIGHLVDRQGRRSDAGEFARAELSIPVEKVKQVSLHRWGPADLNCKRELMGKLGYPIGYDFSLFRTGLQLFALTHPFEREFATAPYWDEYTRTCPISRPASSDVFTITIPQWKQWAVQRISTTVLVADLELPESGLIEDAIHCRGWPPGTRARMSIERGEPPRILFEGPDVAHRSLYHQYAELERDIMRDAVLVNIPPFPGGVIQLEDDRIVGAL